MLQIFRQLGTAHSSYANEVWAEGGKVGDSAEQQVQWVKPNLLQCKRWLDKRLQAKQLLRLKKASAQEMVAAGPKQKGSNQAVLGLQRRLPNPH